MCGRRINSLFFVDDGLLLAGGVEEAREAVRTMREAADDFGLEMNSIKSKCLMYNVRNVVEEIEGIQVVKEIKYLGVMVGDKRELFEAQRRKMVDQARRMSNMTYSVIEKSCHRVKMGKTYWKSVVLPSVLFGMEVIDLREEDIVKLQNKKMEQ